MDTLTSWVIFVNIPQRPAVLFSSLQCFPPCLPSAINMTGALYSQIYTVLACFGKGLNLTKHLDVMFFDYSPTFYLTILTFVLNENYNSPIMH